MRKILAFSLLVVLWQITALLVNRAVIMPLPIDVFQDMMTLACLPSFYISVFFTLLRILIALIISGVIGIALGICSCWHKKIGDFISPIISFLQTIPQISYIIIFLVWFTNTTALIIIIFIMIMPLFYFNTIHGLDDIDDELKDVILLYPHTPTEKIFKAYLPLIKEYLLSALDVSIPLSLKVAVMAEIFVSTHDGIGSLLYMARVSINMTRIFSLTIWMVIIAQVLLSLYRHLTKT